MASPPRLNLPAVRIAPPSGATLTLAGAKTGSVSAVVARVRWARPCRLHPPPGRNGVAYDAANQRTGDESKEQRQPALQVGAAHRATRQVMDKRADTNRLRPIAPNDYKGLDVAY